MTIALVNCLFLVFDAQEKNKKMTFYQLISTRYVFLVYGIPIGIGIESNRIVLAINHYRIDFVCRNLKYEIGRKCLLLNDRHFIILIVNYIDTHQDHQHSEQDLRILHQ